MLPATKKYAKTTGVQSAPPNPLCRPRPLSPFADCTVIHRFPLPYSRGFKNDNLPFYIFGIFLQMGAEGHVGAVLGAFLKIVGFIFLLHVTELVFLFLVAGGVTRRNPFRPLVTMLPAYVTALGTASSAATIPVTLQHAIKNGVRPETASFTVPLCATIHMPCSILKITAVAYAISLSMGLPADFGTYIGFIMMLGISNHPHPAHAPCPVAAPSANRYIYVL